MNTAASVCWLAAVWGPECDPKKHLGPQQVLAAMRCIIVTFNFPLHHIIFAAGHGGGGEEEIDPLIISIYNFLSGGAPSFCLSSIAPHRPCLFTLWVCRQSENWIWGEEIRNEGIFISIYLSNESVFMLGWTRIQKWSHSYTWYPSPHDLVTYTPLASFQPPPSSPCLLSHLFKELYILKTVNFQAKVCHLLLAAGSPGKCR